MADELDDEPRLRIAIDTFAGLPFESFEVLIAGVRSLVEVGAFVVVPVRPSEGDYLEFGPFIAYVNRRRRPSDMEVLVRRVSYGSPLEVIVILVGAGWVVVQAAALTLKVLTTQLAERRELIASANRQNMEASKLEQEARLLRLQGDRQLIENAVRLEEQALLARERARDELLGIRTEVASTLVELSGADAAERFLAATDDAEAFGRAAQLAEFEIVVEVERDASGPTQ